MSTLHRTILPRELARLTPLVATVAAIFLSACGSGAASTPVAGAGSAGSPQAAGSTAQAGGGETTLAGGSDGSGSANISGSGGDAAAVCPPRTELTLAIHVVVDVTWPDTLGADGGSGKMHAWSLARMTADGTSISGTTQPCGSDLPELMLKPLVGGGKFDIEVPDAVWDAPSAPQTASVGTLDGWSTGSSISTEVSNLLVGLTMSDPDGPWPVTHAEVMAVDADADARPGFTGIPKTGNGYVQPPVAAAIAGSGAKADKVYMVSRTAMGLSGSLSSCTEQSGTVSVKFFDNHIVGCHVAGGSECTPEHVDFLDTNRNMFTATGGTFTSKLVPDTATCADARGM